MPLNGRHFTDLGLLVPGSVTTSPTGFSTPPGRGVGPLAINTAGNREEAVAFLVNGVSTNNLTFGSLMFQPPIASLEEFKVDNSAFSAEYGHVSGAIVNIVTRSGSDAFHGEAFEFFRNDALDARNFFEFNSSEPHPFERNQFGGSLGGPVVRRNVLLRDLRGTPPAAGPGHEQPGAQRRAARAATNPVIRQLIELIPRANFVDASGTPRFVGAADGRRQQRPVDARRPPQRERRRSPCMCSLAARDIRMVEPASNGHTIPGFGHVASGTSARSRSVRRTPSAARC